MGLVDQILTTAQMLVLGMREAGTVLAPAIGGVVSIVRLKIKTDADLQLTKMIVDSAGYGELSDTVDSLTRPSSSILGAGSAHPATAGDARRSGRGSTKMTNLASR